MSELTNYISQQGPDNVLAQIRSTPYWWALSMAVKSGKDLFHVVKTMGWTTLADVVEWVNASQTLIQHRETWARLVNPGTWVKADGLGTVSWLALDDARFAQCSSDPDYQRMNSDATYLIPTEAQLRQIAADCPSWRMQYVPERNDCDDFVAAARGWLASQGLGNLAAGKVGIRAYEAGQVIYGHAVLLCFSREAASGPITAWWWEPQDGKLYPVSFTRLGANIFQWPDRVGLAWADF